MIATKERLGSWLAGATTPEELKKLYRQLALQHHPDRGGDTATMQALNVEYNSRLKLLAEPDPTREIQLEFLPFEARKAYHSAKELGKKVGFSVITDGVEVVAVGNQTYHYRDDLKELGFWWQPDRKVWKFVRRPGHRKGGAA